MIAQNYNKKLQIHYLGIVIISNNQKVKHIKEK